MKRYSKKISKTVAIALAMTMLPVSSAFAADVNYGDANADGSVDANDSALTLQHTFNGDFIPPNTDKDKFELAADVDQTAGISANDAAVIFSHVLNKSVKFSAANRTNENVSQEAVDEIFESNKDLVETEANGNKTVKIEKEVVISNNKEADSNNAVLSVAASTDSEKPVVIKQIAAAEDKQAIKDSINTEDIVDTAEGSASITPEEKQAIKEEIEEVVNQGLCVSVPVSEVSTTTNSEGEQVVEDVKGAVAVEAPGAGEISIYANAEDSEIAKLAARGGKVKLARKGFPGFVKDKNGEKDQEFDLKGNLKKFVFNIFGSGKYYIVIEFDKGDGTPDENGNVNIFGVNVSARPKNPDEVVQPPKPVDKDLKFVNINGLANITELKPDENIFDKLNEDINKGLYDRYIKANFTSMIADILSSIKVNGNLVSSEKGWEETKTILEIQDMTAYDALKPVDKNASEEKHIEYMKSLVTNMRAAFKQNDQEVIDKVKANIDKIAVGDNSNCGVSITVKGKQMTDFKEVAKFLAENVLYTNENMTLAKYEETFGNDFVVNANGQTFTVKITNADAE